MNSRSENDGMIYEVSYESFKGISVVKMSEINAKLKEEELEDEFLRVFLPKEEVEKRRMQKITFLIKKNRYL